MNREGEFTKEPNEVPVDREAVSKELEKAKILLEKSLEIYNLSNIELKRLTKDIEDAMRQNAYFEEKYSDPASLDFETRKKNFRTRLRHKVDPYEEAVAKFLLHYGINLDDIVHRKALRQPFTNKLYFYKSVKEYIKPRLKLAREEAHKPYLD